MTHLSHLHHSSERCPKHPRCHPGRISTRAGSARIVWCALGVVVSVMLSATQGRADDRRPDVLAFHGVYSETDLLPIVLRGRTEYRNSWITVLGWNQPLNTHLRSLEFEAEGQLGLHSGAMRHREANGLLVARLPVAGGPVSLALGEGISVASANPSLENREKGMRIGEDSFDIYESYALLQQPGFPWALATLQANPTESRPVLNYIMVEAELRLNSAAWSPGFFMRVHHRSGVFGLYCPPDPACGSNFVTYGVKLRLP